MDEETTCGGDVELIIKTTAYPPTKRAAESINDYETVGTWKLFRGLKINSDLYPLTSGNLRGKELKVGIVSVSKISFIIQFYIHDAVLKLNLIGAEISYAVI